MTIKISDFKQNEVRAKISFLQGNQEKIVTVKNALGKNREKLLQIWEEKSKENSEHAQYEFMKIALSTLTNIEVNSLEDLKEAVSNPIAEMSLILKEVNEIMQEIMVQYWTGKIGQLNQTSIQLLTTIALQKTQEMTELTKEVKEANKPVNLQDLDDITGLQEGV